MKRTFTPIFLAAGFLLFLMRGVPVYATNIGQDVELPIGAGGNQAVLVTTSIPTTSSTASVNNVSTDNKGTGTENGTNPINTGLVVDPTGGTTKDLPTLNGGNVGIGNGRPATGMKIDTGGPVKAAGTGNTACKASDVGAMRYNAAGNYLEICSYP